MMKKMFLKQKFMANILLSFQIVFTVRGCSNMISHIFFIFQTPTPHSHIFLTPLTLFGGFSDPPRSRVRSYLNIPLQIVAAFSSCILVGGSNVYSLCKSFFKINLYNKNQMAMADSIDFIL